MRRNHESQQRRQQRMSDADNAIDFETFFTGKTAPSVVDITTFDDAGLKPVTLVDDLIDFFKSFKIVPQIQASPFGSNKMLVFLPPKSARTAAMKNKSAAQLKTLGLYHVVKFAEFNAAIDACNGAATNLTTAVRGALLSYTCNIATVRSNGKVNDFDFYRGVGQPPREGYPKFELVYPAGYGIPTGSIAVVQLNRVLELPPQFANEALANEKAVFAPAAGHEDDFDNFMTQGDFRRAYQTAINKVHEHDRDIDYHELWQLKALTALKKLAGHSSYGPKIYELVAVETLTKKFHDFLKQGKYTEALEYALTVGSYYDMHTEEAEMWRKNATYARNTKSGRISAPFAPAAGHEDDFDNFMTQGDFRRAYQTAINKVHEHDRDIDYHELWQLKALTALKKLAGHSSYGPKIYELVAVETLTKKFHDFLKQGKYTEALEYALTVGSYYDMHTEEAEMWRKNATYARNTKSGRISAPFAPIAGRKDDFAETKRSSNEELRTLWSEHTKYTALFIVAAIDKLHTLGAIKERLLKNQDDIAAFVVKMVQSQSDEEFPPSKLSEFKKVLATKLKEHIAGAETLVGGLSLLAGTNRDG